MEFLVTALVRFCRTWTDRRLNPIAVQFVHRRSGAPVRVRCESLSKMRSLHSCRTAKRGSMLLRRRLA
jgi:hypothetical protein